MQYKINATAQFIKWHNKILDKKVLSRLDARLFRLVNGNFGDAKRIDANLFELRCTFGGGLRIYYTVKNNIVILLLNGGNKSSQVKDIFNARKIIKSIED